MSAMSEAKSMFGLLRQSADPKVADAIERLGLDGAHTAAQISERKRMATDLSLGFVPCGLLGIGGRQSRMKE